MVELWDTLRQLAVLLGALIVYLLDVLLPWTLAIAWVAWWLWGTDWRQLWPTLARGAWVPLVLLTIMIASAWTFVSPGPYALWGLMIPNGWWQLGAVLLALAIAAFCGWLQMLYGWHPPKVVFVAPGVQPEHPQNLVEPPHGHEQVAHSP